MFKKQFGMVMIWRSLICHVWYIWSCMSRLWNLMIRQLKSVLIWPKLPQTLCQIFEIEDWFNISSYNLFQVAMTSFFLFPTLPLMCTLWWDAYLHNREVPATNLASDCRRPVVSQFPLLFLGIPFSVRHSTELTLISAASILSSKG